MRNTMNTIQYLAGAFKFALNYESAVGKRQIGKWIWTNLIVTPACYVKTAHKT
jgi:hypothetical protein